MPPALPSPLGQTRRTFVGTLIAAAAAPGWRRASGQSAPPIEPVSTTEPTTIEPDTPLPPTVAPTAPSGQPAAPTTGNNAASYFAEPGHNLSYPYNTVWEQWGGQDVFGAPLSEMRAIGANGETQQVFETIVMQFQPAQPEGARVTGYPLDDATISANTSTASRKVTQASGNGQFFTETGHNLTGDMLTFWQQHGGEALLGPPVSEAFTSKGTTVQAFRNAVIEKTSKGTIGLRAIGKTYIATNGLTGDAAVLPAPPFYGETSMINGDGGGVNLRLGPSIDAEIQAVLPDNGEFIKVAGSSGDWVPGYMDGYSGWVSADYLTAPKDLSRRDITLENWDLGSWEGRAIGETNVRPEPTTAKKEVRTLADGDPLDVVDWVRGEEVVPNSYIWAKLKDGNYVFARNVGRAAPIAPPPLPDDAPWEGRWIDIHLTQQLMTAYEGRTPVRTAPVTTGMPGWETPTGWYTINYRVENETMTSGAIGAEYFYELKNVLYTQYFTDRGHALHYAWWRTPETIGRPGSHGCINMLLDDSVFFWNWADYGTGISIRQQ